MIKKNLSLDISMAPKEGGKYSKENLFMEKRDVKYPVT